jgi:hypothetical protein
MSSMDWRLHRHRRDTLRETKEIDRSELEQLRADMVEALTILGREVASTKKVVAEIRTIADEYLKE